MTERSERLVLGRLWSSGKLMHRRAGIDYLHLRSLLDSALVDRHWNMVLEALNDSDLGHRELIISTLYTIRHPQWVDLVRAQLHCDDPFVQLYAMDRLRVGKVTIPFTKSPP